MSLKFSLRGAMHSIEQVRVDGRWAPHRMWKDSGDMRRIHVTLIRHS